MRLFIPLYARIFAWFCLNLVLIGAVMLVALHAQFGLTWASMLAKPTGDRAQAVAGLVGARLGTVPRQDWDEVLEQARQEYGMTMRLYLPGGRQLAGPRLAPPSEVAVHLRMAGMPMTMMQPSESPQLIGMMQSMHVRGAFFAHAGEPARYWVGVHIPVGQGLSARPLPAILLMSADSFMGIAHFLDLMPLAESVLVILILSALLWWPFVHGISRSLKRIVGATDRIAEGHLETRVQVRRHDELGQIGEAINQMAMRLGHFVNHQKRFLGDVAHELCSPLARLQLAAGIIEGKAADDQKQALGDLQEDLDVMSELVNDLLAFSRAALGERRIELRPVELRTLIEDVVRREGADMAIGIDVPQELRVSADERLLRRAAGNLVRNAKRHALGARLDIAAWRADGMVNTRFTDSGPGVPQEVLTRLGEPFLRLDDSRSRESGGTGLGLAIVKTCLAACDGSVSFANGESGGLEVTLRLRHAHAPGDA